MNKKIVKIALVMLSIITILIPADVSAAKKTSGKDLNGNKWKYNNSTKTLTFSGQNSLQECNTSHTKGEGAWFIWKNEVKKVIIKKGIKEVSRENFYNFKNLKTVVFPKSLQVIGASAFSDCSIRKIKLPKNLKRIESCAFSGLFISKLEKVKMPDGLEEIHSMAFENQALKKVVIPDTVTFIGSSAFVGCEKLESVTLSKNITRINAVTFAGCKKLRKIVIRSKKLISIQPDAFNEIPSDATFYVPKKMKKKYTKFLKKCNLGKNVKIVGVRM